MGRAIFNEILANVWLSTTIESHRVKDRIELIRDLKANVKWLSCEPLISDLGELDLSGIDWVIVGGESGFNARAMKESWVLHIKKAMPRAKSSLFLQTMGNLW